MRICKEGWPFILICLLVGGALLTLARLGAGQWAAWTAGLAFLGAAYCAYFFRDPSRAVPPGDRLILSPADGKILEVVQSQEKGSPVWLVRIFLSVFDPHLQRAPMAGEVKAVHYTPGKFLDARNPRAHVENEQNRMEFTARSGAKDVPITVTQIAGLIARRIVCWTRTGETLAAGERYGLIRFGSQVDITFPMSAQVRIKAGDRVEAGQSVLAEIT